MSSFKLCALDYLTKEYLRNKSIKAELTYITPKTFLPLISHLKELTSKSFEIEIRCLLTNIYNMNSKKSALRFSRDKNAFSNNIYKISHSRMMNFLDDLEKTEYINIYVGGVKKFCSFTDKNAYEMSIIEINQKFLDIIDCISPKFRSKKRSETNYFIEVRKRGTKEMIKPVKKKKDELSIGVRSLNSSLLNADITAEFGDKVAQIQEQYKRSFVDDYTKGGRFYCIGGGIQTSSAEIRRTLKFEGQETVELDFKAMHPSISYELINADLAPNFDPYDVDLPSEWVDTTAIEKHKLEHNLSVYSPTRNLIKMACMVAINSTDVSEAKKSIQFEINTNPGDFIGLKKINIDDLVKRIISHNYLISNRFFSDSGVLLQYLDSEILDIVIKKVIEKGEYLLPWHDSVVVKASIAEEVKVFMQEAWLEILKSNRFCKIEFK